MPVTDSEEHGVKIETQSCDVFCMPPKKRHLHRFQSMTTISQPLDFPLGGSQPQHILSLKESEYILNPQMAFPGDMPEKSLAEVKEGLPNNQDSVVDNLPDLPQESQSVADTMVSATVIDNGKFDVIDKKLDGGDKSQLVSGETDLQSAFRESNQQSISRSMSERIPSVKSAFRKVEDIISNDGPFALPAQSSDYNGSIVKQEGLDTSLGDTGLLKGPMLVHCKVEEADSAQLQSNRSNWDLNTVMDSWEGSLAIASGSYGEGGKCSQVFSDVGMNEIKSLDCTPLCEHFHHDACLNLELSSPSASNSHLKLRVPCHLPMASSCNNVSNLRLSIKPLTASGLPNFSLSNSIKPEPYTDFGMGSRSHFEAIPLSLIYKSIKPEPCEEAVKECSSCLLPRNPEVGRDMDCILAVNLESKLETRNCDSLRGTGTMDEEASLTMPADENGADGSNENANSLSDFTSAEQIADCSNNLSYQVQLSSVDRSSQITAISTESNLEPVSNLQVSNNDELIRNSSSGELIKNSVAANCPGASETVCQTYYTSLDSALPIICNSQVIMSAVPPTTLEETSNVGEKLDMDSEDTVTIPCELKSVDQDVSESTTGVSNVDCEPASVCTRPAVATNALDISVQISDFDDSTSLSSAFALLEKSNVDMNENEAVPNADETVQMLEEEPHVHENQGGLQSVVATFQLKAKLHMDDDDDIEDGEVRELNVQPGAISSLCDSKETNQMCSKEPGSLVNPVALPSPSSLKCEVEIRTQNQENAHPSSEFSGNSCGKDIITGAGSLVDVQNPTFEAGPDSDLSKSKPVKTSRKLSRDDSSKEKCNETKQHSKSSSGNYKASVEDAMGEVGSHIMEARGLKLLPADHSFPSKLGLSEKVNDSTNVQSSSSRSRIAHLISNSKDSAVIEKSTEKKHPPSQIHRERPSDMSFRGDAPYRQGTRDESCANEMRKFEKESKKEDTFNNKAEDFARSRGRIEKQLETLRGERNADTDYALERFGRLNSYRFLKSRNASDVGFAGVDDSVESVSRTIRNPPMAEGLDTFSRVSRRRRSPGTRECPGNVGVQIIRRPMRDVSPGRCADGVSNLLLLGHEERFMQRMTGDGVDPSTISGSHSNFEREETFIPRGRSVSPPLLRRGPSRLTRMHSPSSTRRVRSPRQWSPQRSLDGFNVRREAVRGRSPSLQVVRMRSPPNPRDGYMEGVPGRRCGSPPCIPRLRDDIRDVVGPPREFEYVRSGAPIQRNMRRLRLIDARVNGEDYFGPVNSRTRIQEMLEDESLGDRRGGGERHGIIRPLRHRYGEAGEEDLDFQMEHEGHRPIRFRMGDEEDFPDRGRPRGGGIRSRLGELPRRLRSVEERDDGRAWHDADFDDARMKRRRF